MRQIAIVLSLLCSTCIPFQALADEPSVDKPSQQITIQLKEYKFEPNQVILKVNEKIELSLENQGKVMHEFVTDAFKNLTLDIEINGVIIEALGVSEFEIPPGAKVVLHVKPDEKGAFPFVCKSKDPKDHFKEGMSGKLIIQ